MNNVDPSGNIPDWAWWVLGSAVVVGLFAATVLTCGSVTAALATIYVAACGGASTIGVGATIASFAFVGAATLYFGALTYNALNIATAKIRGSSYETAFSDSLAMGDDVFFTTLSGGIIGGVGGAIAYDDQLRGLEHSWTKERNDFFKKHPEYDRSTYVLHHPYGRHGANIRYYVPVTIEEHKQIHHELGYGNGIGGFYQYRQWIEWWKEVLSHL